MFFFSLATLINRSEGRSFRISMRRLFDPSDEFRILVATEVLSEGVNLHRSNIVFNYDIPWNPTRLIQRVGRVNRVDTKFDTIHTYNFFPNGGEQRPDQAQRSGRSEDSCIH